MKNILIHLPHTSMYIPEEYRRTAMISREELEAENRFMCDTGITGLLPDALEENTVVFPYSRLYCDVERFRDERESMAACGMGYIYTHDSLGRRMFRPSEDHIQKIDEIYDAHHAELGRRASDLLEKYGSCIIIDLHSYSDEAVFRLSGHTGCPDVCIGVEPDYCSGPLVGGIAGICRGLGLSTKINYPYSGSIVPERYYGKKHTGIVSVMIEINKRILRQETRLSEIYRS